MAKRFLRCTTALAAIGLATAAAPTGASAQAVTQDGIDINFVAQGKFQPTYVGAQGLLGNNNFRTDAGGNIQTDDEHVRSEIRFGATFAGDNWTGKIILENDFTTSINTVDRINRGQRFGLERVYFTYEFSPAFKLGGGWEFKALDIGTGGLLYGDDAPTFGFSGDLGGGTSYEIFWMPITDANDADQGFVRQTAPEIADGDADMSVFAGKVDFDLGEQGRVAPIIAHARNNQHDNNNTWFGGEYVGNFGKLNVLAEAMGAFGEFDSGAGTVASPNAQLNQQSLANDDIQAYAAYFSAKYKATDAFQPYASFRLNSGDDDPFDNDVEGWLGITDISRFSGHDGIDGGFFGYQPVNPALGSGLFGTGFDFAGPASSDILGVGRSSGAPIGGNGATYGGIQNSGTGLNPGQIRGTVGSTGNLTPKLSYHGQVNVLWYEATGGLEAVPGSANDVDSFAGVQGTAQLKYQWGQYVSTRAIASVFEPGQGVDDTLGGEQDTAGLGMVELKWAF
ncbi:hypothetical protein SAMN05216241_10855 [Limimonas halophila]|uniref:Alginate export n=1 Tax=Limimonas halophila TaxID=1082479 RepID=A0A1G7T2E3_9PROT|nr:hypothetical protein [Limimonas halophila]SDG29398.1 hypothetical protein SAMN05216241_10855 [Limimonas halophila]